MADATAKPARAVVREREKAIWNTVEEHGRQTRAAEAAKAAEVAKPRENVVQRRGETQRP